eukprot:CAMPEP_0173468158 /NCGR_PEP_ID=MMETSP1357-20121228/76368_1 /TAXON_ID=77926 /ORGANISM="Hemiselmis rufescens, Strain PCC563" /LENGTH=31 /DNA_ID= /DNA_START= /DNA_END= /DNA_ORIENTATION=
MTSLCVSLLSFDSLSFSAWRSSGIPSSAQYE